MPSSSEPRPITQDRLSALYEAWALAFHGPVHRAAVERAALRSGERFLEVGVGSGRTFLPLVLRNPSGENQGVDLSPVTLERCRARLAGAGARQFRLTRADARELPFPPDCFDLALGCFLLDVLCEADRDRVLAELRRVLRPGGRLILVQMTGGGMALYDLLASRAPLLLGGSRPVSLGPRLIEAGFRDVSRLLYRRFRFASELVRAVKI